MPEDRPDLLEWLAKHCGEHCLVRVTGPSGAVVAALRGELGERDEGRREGGADFFVVHDGHSEMGIGLPGFLVPHDLLRSALVDGHGAMFSCDEGVTTRIVLAYG